MSVLELNRCSTFSKPAIILVATLSRCSSEEMDGKENLTSLNDHSQADI